MKFPQLPPGARFEYQGQVYTKTGPLAATPEAGGGQRIIPRSALLRPLGGEPPPSPRPTPRALDSRAVLVALAAYHQTCLELMPDRTDALEAARRQCLAALGLPEAP